MTFSGSEAPASASTWVTAEVPERCMPSTRYAVRAVPLMAWLVVMESPVATLRLRSWLYGRAPGLARPGLADGAPVDRPCLLLHTPVIFAGRGDKAQDFEPHGRKGPSP